MTSPARPVPRSTRNASRIRVLIVDDSLVIRHLIREALGADPAIEIVGAEANGALALARIPALKPDLVTLDIEMPVMDGLETLRQIRKLHPQLRTIMFSTMTTRGASVTLEALALGADDYVTKASNAGSLDKSLASLRGDLIPKIKQFFALPIEPLALPPLEKATPPPGSQPAAYAKPSVVLIGVSTGGPQALAQVIPKLPAAFPLPVLIVQHMPPMFTRLLAERLDATSPIQVSEAQDGIELRPGLVIVARGDYHLCLRRSGAAVVVALDRGKPENSCRPSVDVTFRSAAEVYGASALAVMLTGMGSDGLRGVHALKAAGARSLVQDQASSVVWGMPGAVVEAGLADRILPLDQIPGELVRLSAV
jgi:two-component system, chemotaxis family, protein-glutamate methylesterase/glutaminase